MSKKVPEQPEEKKIEDILKFDPPKLLLERQNVPAFLQPGFLEDPKSNSHILTTESNNPMKILYDNSNMNKDVLKFLDIKI